MRNPYLPYAQVANRQRRQAAGAMVTQIVDGATLDVKLVSGEPEHRACRSSATSTVPTSGRWA